MIWRSDGMVVQRSYIGGSSDSTEFGGGWVERGNDDWIRRIAMIA